MRLRTLHGNNEHLDVIDLRRFGRLQQESRPWEPLSLLRSTSTILCSLYSTLAEVLLARHTVPTMLYYLLTDYTAS